MAKLAPQLRVVEGGNNSNAVTRLYKTIDDITRQMKIRRDEAIKGNISLKNSYYTDKFYGGSKFKSPKIADISWLLTIRFLEKSWTRFLLHSPDGRDEGDQAVPTSPGHPYEWK